VHNTSDPSKDPKVTPVSIRTTHRALLSRLLPDDKPDDLPVRQGQFHNVVIGSDRVVCLPRTRAAAARLPERMAALHALAGLDLGFRTPEPLLQGGAHGTDEAPFLVLSRIPGEPLEIGALNDARVAGAVAAQYATLLSALARAGTDETVRRVLPHAAEGQWRRFTENVRAELFQLMSDGGRLRAERELAALDSLPCITRAVVHGDLGAENVLWEWTHGLPHLSGVLDWDDVTLSDPAEDLAAIAASYGPELLERVLALGSWSNHGLRTRIAAIRGTFALQQALYAIRDSDEEQLADGLTDYR
jgi:aminoglycoside phosphotransferase (APT) family kinase protein